MKRGITPPRIVSVEHSLEWLHIAEKRLRSHELDRYVHFVNAPIVPLESAEGSVMCYAPAPIFEAIQGRNVDLLLIDGPPGFNLTDPGRAGTLYAVEALLNDGCLVVVDDTHRCGERLAIREWKQTFGKRIRRMRGWLTLDTQVEFEWHGVPGR
ncbi:hypothetical protein Thiowin_02711 [Thiorhodovibrio winogradskyi]|uniref:Uncharacterized protein n=2 Tax=Thiorhodovibrio winogradskyi TaxID=77007 RepID=A0ABZ0S9S1_9GAMM